MLIYFIVLGALILIPIFMMHLNAWQGRRYAWILLGLTLISATISLLLKNLIMRCIDWIANANMETEIIFPETTHIIINIVLFAVLFILALLFSWLVILPKIKKHLHQEIPTKSFRASIVGMLQGIIISFVLMVPINGFILQSTQVAQPDNIYKSRTAIQEYAIIVSSNYKNIDQYFYTIIANTNNK